MAPRWSASRFVNRKRRARDRAPFTPSRGSHGSVTPLRAGVHAEAFRVVDAASRVRRIARTARAAPLQTRVSPLQWRTSASTRLEPRHRCSCRKVHCESVAIVRHSPTVLREALRAMGRARRSRNAPSGEPERITLSGRPPGVVNKTNAVSPSQAPGLSCRLAFQAGFPCVASGQSRWTCQGSGGWPGYNEWSIARDESHGTPASRRKTCRGRTAARAGAPSKGEDLSRRAIPAKGRREAVRRSMGSTEAEVVRSGRNRPTPAREMASSRPSVAGHGATAYDRARAVHVLVLERQVQRIRGAMEDPEAGNRQGSQIPL
jgi:hypothetical protein